MMKNHFFHFSRCFILFMTTLALKVDAASSEHASVRLSGHIPSKEISKAAFLNKLDATTHIPLTFILPLRNKEALEELIQCLYDPTNQQHYGKYLTPADFAEQFGPSQEDYDHLVAYVNSLGLTVTGTHPNRTLLNVAGPAKSIETAFNLRLSHYQKANGQTFYAPDNNPEVSTPIASIIHGIVGLDNHAKWHTYNRQKKTTEKTLISNEASHTHPSGPGGGYSPRDLLIAYNLTNVSANGSNQSIALFELGTYQASDINEYARYFGLPTPKLRTILVGGGASGPIDPEVTLDIELVLALAPQGLVYVYEGPNSDQGVLNTYNQIATDNFAKQVSTSWGLGENYTSQQYLQAENAIFLQMAAHGQTIYAAAGDDGAYDDYPTLTLMVDDPASQPYVVGVGGTRLTVNATSGAYSSESVWNNGQGNGAGGGGVSTVWALPTWQTNVSTKFSKTHRNVPDVSLNADPDTGYAIFFNGQWTIYGGTSCAAPLWAAFTACVNQQLTASQKPPLGFANPLLYAIGLGASYAQDFHDITVGNNLYYSAGKDYDNASGWGSFNGTNLFATLTNSLAPSPSHSLLPLLNIAMTHPGSFVRGETGTYKIAVSNHGNHATLDPLTVFITLPNGLKYRSLSGTGWKFDADTLVCTQNDSLQASSSYPPITLIVDIDHDAPNSVTPTVTVSGGRSAPCKTTANLTLIK